MNADRLDNLIDAWLSGEAAPEQCADLGEALRAEPEARRRLVERSLLEVHLYRACAAAAAAGTAPPGAARLPRRARRLPLKHLALAAAVLLAAGAGVLLYVARPWAARPGYELVTGDLEVAGAPGFALAKPGGRLAEGAAVRVAGAAPAVVRLPDGSRAELEPASEAVLRGRVGDVRQVVELVSGAGRFSVARGPGGFRVDTPLGSVTALATEFSVRVRPGDQEALEVAVAEGRVRVDVAARSYVLAAGERRLFEARAPEREGPPAAEIVRGEIARVAADRLTVALKREGLTVREETFTMGPATEIRLETRVGAGDLRVGQEVKVAAGRRLVAGEVVRIDGGRLTLLVRHEGAPAEETVTVDAETEIVAEVRGTAAGLEVGRRVVVAHKDGAATRIVMLLPAPPRPDGEGERR